MSTVPPRAGTWSGHFDPRCLEQGPIIALVAVTSDLKWAGQTAWALARLAADHLPRVALFDLSLSHPVLDRVVGVETQQGVVDAFLHDAALNEVAHGEANRDLHFVGVGSLTPNPSHVLASQRWRRVARGFAHERATLLAFLPTPDALDSWSIRPDTVIALLEAPHARKPRYHPRLAGWPLAATLYPPQAKPPATPNERSAPPTEPGDEPDRLRSDGPEPEAAATDKPPKRQLDRRRVVAAGLLVAVVGGIGIWARTRPSADPAPATALSTPPEAPEDRSPVREAVSSAVDDALEPAPVDVDSLFFSLRVAAFRQLSRAEIMGGQTAREMPVAITPTFVGGTLWYRVNVGAFATRAEADSALAELWEGGRLPAGEGTVVRTPYAVAVGAPASEADTASVRLETLRDRGIPAYVWSALGGSQVLVGALERSDQMAAAESLLAQAGFTANLVSRIGRLR